MRPNELLDRIRSLVGDAWTVDDAVETSAHVEMEISLEAASGTDLVGDTLDLAVRELPTSGVTEASLRQFCGEIVVLSLLGLPTPYAATTLKAVVAAIHVLIDRLGDYSTAAGYCSFVLRLAKERGLWHVAVVASGDLGIALARSGDMKAAIAPLEEAIDIALSQDDKCAAARYGSELGRCHFELGDRLRSRAALETALDHATECDDSALRLQITSNLSVLGRQ